MQHYPDLNQLMRDAEAHFVAGRHAEARPLTEQILRFVPAHPAVLHLHGLVLSRLGELEAARQALEAALRGLPRDAQIANNLGNLLSRMGESEAAIAAYDKAIAANPGFTLARLHRATLLDELGRHDEAGVELAALKEIEPANVDILIAIASVERNRDKLRAAAAALDEVLAIDPSHQIARRGRLALAADLGEADAADCYRRALAEDPDDRELLIGYIGAADSQETRSALLDRVRTLLTRDPAWYEGHRALAAASWESGMRDDFCATYEAAVAVRASDPLLWLGYIDALGKAGDYAAAAEACRRAEAATGDSSFAVATFGYCSAGGDVDGAEALLARLPADTVSPVALAKHRLRQREAAAAEALLDAATAANPDDIEAWALRGIAWQLLGDPRFHWLNGQDGAVGVDDLPLGAADIAAIADRLRALHARSFLRIGQSVRGGTQTAGNLFDRAEPELIQLRDAIRAGVERYRQAMPPADPKHPLLKHRDRRFDFAGSWSIRLTAGGFHVQHMHPQGILSAASYWAVPRPESSDPGAGWLEIGGTPAYLDLDLPPLHSVEPKVGRLVLFPSTLHHGTRPFPAGERMSVAFDIVAR